MGDDRQHRQEYNNDLTPSSRKSLRFEERFVKTHHGEEKIMQRWCPNFPTTSDLKQYIAVIICYLCIWATSWFVLGNLVVPGGCVFNISALVTLGYVVSHTVERYTTLNPVITQTLVGVLCKMFIPINILEDKKADLIDYHLRRVYPVIILTKGPLTWNWNYIRHNPVKVFSLATLPWIVECLSTAFFSFIYLDFPWYWGIHLGAILSSVSPAIVVPIVIALNTKGLGTKSKLALLVGNAGGLDTAFTEGMFGVINSAIFYESTPALRIIKAFTAIFFGVALGVAWGVLADILPDHDDTYAPAIRSLHLFAGGMLFTYAGGYFGWGGISGVAIMVSAGAAATRWAQRGWELNNNPVSEIYTTLWVIFESMLFTLSGYFIEVSDVSAAEFGVMVACIFSALVFRLLTAFLVALANSLPVKESIFVAITWIPKAIVEACLVRVASDSLWKNDTTDKDRKIAIQHSNMIIIAILITSTIGSILTRIMAPILLSSYPRVGPEAISTKPNIPSNEKRPSPCLDAFQYIDT
ncbi:sodium/hydrogen exchanger 9B1-like isoform X1 [Pieris napi]|uniref:sodium/hydrogen exchanger 9B1-like isoform X1 n=2 Tax=Pieris napi TaxID=78633 RepID=UPI001FBAEE58|nr:sodium/hydrogen exchanger 9B1-like isoform X1 [Pieris napi]